MVWWFTFAFCAFAYLQAGHWLARLHWWVWFGRPGLDGPLAFMLFPVSTAMSLSSKARARPNGMANISLFGDSRGGYMIVKTLTWPLTLTFSLGCASLIVALAAACLAIYGAFLGLARACRLGSRCVAAMWFGVTEGPARLVARALGKRKAPAAAPRKAEMMPVDELGPATRLEELAALHRQREVLDREIDRLEREDAAERPAAYREVPLEALLEGDRRSSG